MGIDPPTQGESLSMGGKIKSQSDMMGEICKTTLETTVSAASRHCIPSRGSVRWSINWGAGGHYGRLSQLGAEARVQVRRSCEAEFWMPSTSIAMEKIYSTQSLFIIWSGKHACVVFFCLINHGSWGKTISLTSNIKLLTKKPKLIQCKMYSSLEYLPCNVHYCSSWVFRAIQRQEGVEISICHPF